MARAIALATPFFFGLILLEYLWGRARGRDTYRLNDTINSLSLGVLSQLSNLFTTALRVGIYALAFEHVAVLAWPADSVLVWLFAVVFYDFCYYWQHRAGHESAIFWAAHVAHHQSQEFNLSTARSWDGSSICRWRSLAFRRRCSRPPRWSICCTSTGYTPSTSVASAGSIACSRRRRTTACITRSTIATSTATTAGS
jgi:hypothetical protein